MNTSRHFQLSSTGLVKRVLALLAVFGAMWMPLAVQAGDDTNLSSPAATLTYHLSTNAVGRAAGRIGNYKDFVELVDPYSIGQKKYDDTKWGSNFWLSRVRGLSATPVGFSNILGGAGLPTMVSPRHYLFATHVHPEGYLIAFLDTNNVLHWRRTLQRADVGDDTSVGILNQDLPPEVGFLPVLPDNFTNYLPTTVSNIVQGIGMNQDLCLFGEPMNFGRSNFVVWNSQLTAPSGLATNWNVTIRGGDSSNPAMLLVGNQLVLVSHNYFVGGGPNYARQISAINQTMHLLSTSNHVRTDYQLTLFPLTNWPAIH